MAKRIHCYFVSTQSVSAKKLNCQYGRKNQFCLLSEHLWKSNFQKQGKRMNPDRWFYILSFGSIWRCFEATRRCFYATHFLLVATKKYGDSYWYVLKNHLQLRSNFSTSWFSKKFRLWVNISRFKKVNVFYSSNQLGFSIES